MAVKIYGSGNGELIALDDGHGLQTAGKRTPFIKELGRQVRENEFNREVVNFLKDILVEHGFRVILTAPTDYDTPLRERTDIANDYKADAYVSIHFNAMGNTFDYSSASGISVHIYPGHRNKKAGKLAELVGNQLRKGTKQVYRGIKEDNFAVLRNSNMPAILTENGFMDDLVEARLMLKKSFQLEVASESAHGLCDFFGKEYTGTMREPVVVKLDWNYTNKQVHIIYKEDDGINIYTVPDWESRPYYAYKAGEARDILGKYSIDGSEMFQIKGKDGSVYWITAADEYVEVIDKPEEKSHFISGKPKSEADINKEKTGFTDVPSGAYYADAIKFFVEEGILSGYGNETFGSDDPLKRKDFAIALYKYANNEADISYQIAIDWVKEQGIMNGYTSGDFGEEDPLKRKDFASALYRYAGSL